MTSLSQQRAAEKQAIAAVKRSVIADARRKEFDLRTRSIFQNQLQRMRKITKQADAKLPYTLDEFREWFQCGLDAGCAYTGDALTLKGCAADHRVPLKRGGDWKLSNLALCTPSANFAKGELTSVEFYLLLKWLGDLAPEARTDVRRRLAAGGKMLRMRF